MPYTYNIEEPKFFNPEEELKALCEREFEDSLEALVALAIFKHKANSFGNRGGFPGNNGCGR